MSCNNIKITEHSFFDICNQRCTFLQTLICTFYKNLIVIHHGDNNFRFWHLYQIYTFSNNHEETIIMNKDEETITSHLMCVIAPLL